MKKVLKWIGIVLGGLVGLLVIAAIGLAIYGNVMFKRTIPDRPLYPITADTSPEGLARGKYLMEQVMDCTEACHANIDDGTLSGNVEEVNEGPISALFAVPNLTPDVETGLGGWTDAEIARAIREGVDKDGVGLVIMPSSHYNTLSDSDVAAVIGYLRSLDPMTREIPPIEMNTFGKAIIALGVLGSPSLQEPITVEKTAPPAGTAEYGEYLIALGACRECHQQNLAGGPLPFSEPDDAPAANLTPGGELVGWTTEDFVKAVSEGIHPTGRELVGMPQYGASTEDLTAIFEYLKTLPAVQTNQ